MKKLLSLVMSLVMLMSIAAGAEFSAKAETYEEIKLGQTKTVVVNDPTDQYDMVMFMYMATKTGKHYFYSTGNIDTYGLAATSDVEEMNDVIMEDDNYKNGNFCIEMNLTKRDIVVFTAYANERGSFKVTLSDKAPSGYTPCTHSYKRQNQVKATLTDVGYTGEKVCTKCSKTLVGSEVPKIATVKLSKNTYTYNGKVQKPSAIVKDSTGKALVLDKDYTVTYSNASSKTVGKYTATIKFKGNYSGTKTIGYHITAASPKTVKLSTNNFVYNGKVQKPSVVAKDSAGNTLVLNKDYTVTYSDANSKALGKYTVTIKFKGNYTGTKTIGYHINPKGTEFVPSSQGGFKAIKNGFTLKWNKQSSQTTGYQIQYATKRDFSNAASVTITNTNTTSYTFKNRAGGTRYYVRIRTYKKANGKTYFSAWNSGTKSVVTLK